MCVHISVILLNVLYLVSPQVAPSNFSVIDTASTSVTFQWDALSNQQANGLVQQYVVTCTEKSANRVVSKINKHLTFVTLT